MIRETYKCPKCDTVFTDGIYIVEDGVTYLCDDACCELFIGQCPNCKHEDCQEVERCSSCGEYVEISEIRGGVCKSCIDRYRNDREACYEIAQNTPREEIKLNAFVISLFTAAEIEDILITHAREHNITDCGDFIDSDDDWFGEQISLREGAKINA